MAAETGTYPDHRPVLYQEVLTLLAPASPRHYLDCTVGAGGHAQGILEACAPAGTLLGLDLDPSALELAARNLAGFEDRVILRQGSYAQSARFLSEVGWQEVAGIVLDLGVSSMQLDRPDRGFSFREEGPLDMRFNPAQKLSAADLVNGMAEEELADLIWRYGEERHSRRVARAIVQARPLTSTTSLAQVVRKSVGYSASKLDPATRTFQALRIAVNDELNIIEQALPDLIALLGPAGRLAVISFHSLEDRIVKQAFKRESQDCICPPEQPVCTCGHRAQIKILTPHPLVAGPEEKQINPRARSAKLRVAEKLN